MRYMRLFLAYLIGTTLLVAAMAVGLPLLVLEFSFKKVNWASGRGIGLVKKAQRALSGPFQKALRFAQRVHPDGGGKYV